ncbi:MAG: integron integrase [Fibrobacteria bacterium]
MAFAALGKEIKLRHYSVKTFKVYHHWMRAFFRFLGVTPVKALTAGHARAFIENLAVERKVAGSTQNQAFNALLFFYVNVLKVELEGFEKTPRAATRHEIPAVLTRGEVQGMLAELEYPYRLFVQLLYGCGLRLNEALTLRVQDLDLEGGMIRVHNGKGDRSRALPLPKTLVSDLRKHLQSVRALFEADLKVGFAGVFLPEALERKYQGAARSWAWQWVFPGGRLTVSEADGKLRRFHLHETSVQKEIKAAAEAGGFAKRVTAHTFRHSYATHLLQMGYDIRIVQDLLGHKDLETTMIYTHVLQSQAGKVVSPLDV